MTKSEAADLLAESQSPKPSWALVGLFWFMAFTALTVAQSFFIPIAVALLIALVFSPVRRAGMKVGIGPVTFASLSVSVLVALSGCLLFFVSAPLQAGLAAAPDLAEEATTKLMGVFGAIEPMLDAGEQLSEIATPEEDTVVVRESGALSLLTEATPVIIGQIIFALTLAFFLIASGDMFYEKLVEVMPTIKDKKNAIQISREIEEQLSTYLLTITTINAGAATCVALAMWALGIPNALLIGLAAFVLNYIPYLGPLSGVVLTFFFALAIEDTLVAAIIPAAVYWLIMTVEGQVVTPVLVGRRLKLNPVVVFLSVALWAWLWSIMGMFLATPMLIALKAFSDKVEGLNPLGRFLAQRGRPSSRDRVVLKWAFKSVKDGKVQDH